MDPQAIPCVLSLVVAAMVSLGTAIYAWSRRPAPGAASLALLMLGAAAFALPYGLQMASDDLSTALFWYKLSFPGGVSLVPAWLIFALEYAGHERWLTKRNLALVAVVPLLSVLLGWTNELHSLYGSDFRMDTSGPFPVLSWRQGPGFWIHAAYAYVLALVATALLVKAARGAPRWYAGQAAWLLIGAGITWGGNLIFALGLSPIPQIDPSPFTFTLTGLAWSWGIFRYRLFDIVPVARGIVFENMSDGVIVLDTQNRVVDLNPAAGRILNRPRSQVIGQPMESILVARSDLIERYGEVATAHEKIAVEGEGGLRHFDLRISPLHDQRSRLRGRLVVLGDITEQVQAEEALTQQAWELAHSNAELRRFTYVASHHLQEPLRMVTLYAQLLARRYTGQLDAEADQFITFITEGATYTRQLIRDLLVYSRIDQGGATFELVPCDAVLDQALDNLRTIIEESGAAVTHGPLPTVMADPTQLGQVFQNLIDNAIKFHGEGTPRVHVSARQGQDVAGEGGGNDDAWLFAVCDEGVGIDPAYSERIFEVFQRLHTREAYPGTGIGLAICKKIVEHHGGRIWVESQPGEGATFYFTLPMGESRASELGL